MTAQADRIRNRRRAFAAPGSSLDRTVRWLAIGLPALVGVVVALMVVTPLGPRGEVSFLLNRNKVATAPNRLFVDNAVYRGEDEKGREFSLTAGQAVQHSASQPVVQMRDLIGRMLLQEGPAQITAPTGNYNYETQLVTIPSVVRFVAADGYRMDTSGVAGAVPAGTFSADSIHANLEQRTVSLQGHAHLRMVPGKMGTMQVPH